MEGKSPRASPETPPQTFDPPLPCAVTCDWRDAAQIGKRWSCPSGVIHFFLLHFRHEHCVLA